VKAKGKKEKPQTLLQWGLILSGKQEGAVALREGCDIVTGETCISAFLNVNNLGDAAVLLFPVCGQGCAYLSLQLKAIKPHLAFVCPVLIGFS
jgi:hypothetical protein